MVMDRDHMCGAKQRHETKQAARHHLNAINRNLNDGSRFEVYRCVYCDGWHVGHRINKMKREDRKESR